MAVFMDRNTAEGHKKIRLARLRLPFRDPAKPCQADGAQEKTRTSTTFRPQVPETCASTNSATWAGDLTTLLDFFWPEMFFNTCGTDSKGLRLGGGGLYGDVARPSTDFFITGVYFAKERTIYVDPYHDVGRQAVFRGSLLRPVPCCANFPDRIAVFGTVPQCPQGWVRNPVFRGVSAP
jgi:hypothetical protein